MPDVSDNDPYHEKKEQEKTEQISASTQNPNAQQLSPPDLHHSHQSEPQDKEIPSLVEPDHIQPANVYMTQEIPDNKPKTQEKTDPTNKVKNTHPSPTQLKPNPESSKKESSEKKHRKHLNLNRSYEKVKTRNLIAFLISTPLITKKRENKTGNKGKNAPMKW